MLNKSSKTHEAFFAFYGNEFIGNINHSYNSVISFFKLQEVNKQLAKENSELRHQLSVNQLPNNTQEKIVVDSTLKDTLNRSRKYTFLPASVVGNSIVLQNNFLTLERGSDQGVELGMSVIAPQGIVGVVVQVSNNFCMVMSVLNRNSRVSAMLKKDNASGTVEWSGTNPTLLTLKNVTKGVKVNLGDTVVTSAYSANFPSNILVGTVVSKSAEAASNFYTLTVKAATPFSSLQYVYIVKNVRYEEQHSLENKVIKSNE